MADWIEDRARIADITSAEVFDGDSVVILDSDYLMIPDSVGTRGVCTVIMTGFFQCLYCVDNVRLVVEKVYLLIERFNVG